MPTSSSAALFKGTPTISVKDNRGLAVRTVQYNRTTVTDKLDCLITRSTYNATGQLASSSDPRLFKQGINNISKINNLLGQPLRVDSVDAGWHIALSDIEGMPHKEWDELGTVRYYDYDESFHRPIAVHELHTDIKGETKQVTERFVYGDSTQTNDNLNLQLIRHYDHAGLSETTSINLTGQPLTQNRQLLLSKSGESDWQESDETAWKDKLNSTVYPTQWTYNALGTMLSQLDAKGNRQRSEYDVSGVLSASYLLLVNQPESSEKTLVSDIKYNANGQKIHERSGNKVVTSYTYDERDWRLMQILTERPVKEGRNTQLQNLNYTYDPVGNIVSIKDATEATRFYKNQRVVPEQTYTYDALYQLITASGRENDAHPQQNSTLPPLHDASNYINYSRTYTYDKAGNLLTIGHNGANQYTLNMVVSSNSNRTVQQISDDPISADKVDELFDAHGNLKQLEHSKALTWGRHNQLKKVALTNKQHEVYQYSAQGARIRKLLSDDDNDNESEVIYLPGLELRTKRGSVSEILHVVTLMNTGRSQVRLLHWQEDCLPSDIPNNQLRYNMDNHLGSSNLELNCNADILTMEEYYPFGGTALWSAKNQTEAKYKTIRYSGKERDETGLYYYGYRYYMPWMGRWLNPDPAWTVDGLNLYRMVRNNPVTLVDNNGLSPSPVGNYEVEVTTVNSIKFSFAAHNSKPLTFNKEKERYDNSNEFSLVMVNDGDPSGFLFSDEELLDNIRDYTEKFEKIKGLNITQEKIRDNINLGVNISEYLHNSASEYSNSLKNRNLNDYHPDYHTTQEYFAVVKKKDKENIGKRKIYALGEAHTFTDFRNKTRDISIASLVAHPYTQVKKDMTNSINDYDKEYDVKRVGSYATTKMISKLIGSEGRRYKTRIITEAVNVRSAAIASKYGAKHMP